MNKKFYNTSDMQVVGKALFNAQEVETVGAKYFEPVKECGNKARGLTEEQRAACMEIFGSDFTACLADMLT